MSGGLHNNTKACADGVTYLGSGLLGGGLGLDLLLGGTTRDDA